MGEFALFIQCLASPFSIPFYRDRLIRGDIFVPLFGIVSMPMFSHTFWMRQAVVAEPFFDRTMFCGASLSRRILLWDAHFIPALSRKLFAFYGRFRKGCPLHCIVRSVPSFHLGYFCGSTAILPARIIFPYTGADNGAPLRMNISPLFFPSGKYSNARPSVSVI